MLRGLGEVRAGPGSHLNSGAVGSVSKSIGVMMNVAVKEGLKVNSGTDSVGPGQKELGFQSQIQRESASCDHGPYESQGNLDKVGSRVCCEWGDPSVDELGTWPDSIVPRWVRVNLPKNRNELGLLSWNANGRLDLRGCREGLIRRWAGKGLVDIALIQETLKKSGSIMYDMFGADWWSVSSWAAGEYGRGSGGCTIFGQPSLIASASFKKAGGRICGTYIADGLILNVYFPTKATVLSKENYRTLFASFVDDLIAEVLRSTNWGRKNQEISWLICGTDTNAHFAG